MIPNETKQRFGERLHRARLMRGLSLRDTAALLADLGCPLSHAALQKYEKGLMGPDSGVVLSLGKVFDVDAGYFFRSNAVKLETIEFRKHANVTVREIDRIREEAADFFEKYLQIEGILEIDGPVLPRRDLQKLRGASALAEAAEVAAQSIREKWKLGEAPLANVHEMLEENGVKVMEVQAGEKFCGFSGWADQRTPIVVLAQRLNDDLPRKRLTALHELGHLVLQFPAAIEHKLKESLCFRFGGALLLPAESLRARVGTRRPDGISFPELIGIKEDWGISIAALMRRAADLGIITDAQLRRYYIRASKNRKIEPGKWVGTENANRFPQLVHRAAAQELITRSKAAELLGVSLREFDRLSATHLD